MEQTDGPSLEEQGRRVYGVALMKGLEIARVYEEPGVSSYVPLEERPAGRYGQALVRVRAVPPSSPATGSIST
jgi:hypothetical protein